MQPGIQRLTLFIVLSYAISWLIWLPMYGPAIELPALPKLPFNHALGAYGPMLASFVTTLIFSKKEFAGLLKKIMNWGNIFLFLLSLLSPFVLYIISSLISNLYFGINVNLSPLGKSTEFPQWAIATVIFYNIVTFGIGEETGWRGLALPILQDKFNALKASVILTLIWAGWHLPLFLYRPGYVNMGAADIAGWILSLLTGSILLTWLFNSSKGSILLCAIFHATIDVAFTSPAADKHIVSIMGMLITIVGISVIFIFGPQKLSFSNKIQSQL
ncbi:MAG: hypothetical protein JWQ38_3329 [Flavipsychrobacter sp.]|nr:hypothetical protein [Flavipsychrobacter sp.]